MSQRGFEIPKDRIVEFCRRHHIVKLALFGSVLRHEQIQAVLEFAARSLDAPPLPAGSEARKVGNES